MPMMMIINVYFSYDDEKYDDDEDYKDDDNDYDEGDDNYLKINA